MMKYLRCLLVVAISGIAASAYAADVPKKLTLQECIVLRSALRALDGYQGFDKDGKSAPQQYKLGALRGPIALDALALFHADSDAAPDDWRFVRARAFLLSTPEPTLPITGADLVARGVTHGQRVGATLKKLQALWIRAGFPREPEALARLLDQALEP